MPKMYAARVNDTCSEPSQSGPVTYRSAANTDIDRIVELWALAGLGSGSDDGDSAQDRAEIATRLERDRDLFVVAEQGERLVATVMGCYDGHRGWVKRFAVHPDLQRSGVGRLLNAELERRFVAAGITELRLSAWRTNEPALDFWASMGFDEINVAYFTKSLR